MKRLLFCSLCAFLAGFQTMAQNLHHRDSSDSKLASVASVLDNKATIEKQAGNVQNGLDGIKKLSNGKVQKKLNMFSKGIANIMKAEKSVSKIGDTATAHK